MPSLRNIALLVVLKLLFFPVSNHAATTISKASYHGWKEAFTLSNGKVEAIVVPAIGRVMQFRFVGENDGPFWENRALDGKAPDSQSSDWINFGGDKTWPAPQAEWEKITGRGWPPPAAFDSTPVAAMAEGETLVLRSEVDRHYGIQTERRITLLPNTSTMRIDTTYLKKEGDPVRVSIWTITQVKDPKLVLMPLPKKSLFPAGYNKQSEILPLDLKVEKGILICGRSRKNSTKIGSDASKLFWADERLILEVHAERETAAGEFPDQNSSAEIYTNPDPLPYVELELLGPLYRLNRGEKISRSQVYRLFRRDRRPVEEQLRALIDAP